MTGGDVQDIGRFVLSDRVIGLGMNKVLSVPDAVGIAIEKWMIEKQGVQQELLPHSPAALLATTLETPVVHKVTSGAEQMKLEGVAPMLTGACPDCGLQLEFAEGCVKCHVCGYSVCG